MLNLYQSLTRLGEPALRASLKKRLKRGKEDPERLAERMGIPGCARPQGKLLWFHAASVGEAQSTLILIQKLMALSPRLNILVTTGTKTSADLMAARLPGQAIHQYIPLDHPDWVRMFLDHWAPDMVIWMESELWPNMLGEIRNKRISAILMNAHMSEKSFKRWLQFPKSIARILMAFEMVIVQTEQDAEKFTGLGAIHVRQRTNLKYSADALPFDNDDLNTLRQAIGTRPVWLYASTHAGEEDIAVRVHKALVKKHESLLTIIVPRHPERRGDIQKLLAVTGEKYCFRGMNKTLPAQDDSFYIADSLGELGLFYSLSPIACIGRSFSDDGGGGHNPVEAARLGCAVLHGPLVQNLQEIFDEMDSYGAAECAQNPDDLIEKIDVYLSDDQNLGLFRERSRSFAQSKSGALDILIKDLEPALVDAGIIDGKIPR